MLVLIENEELIKKVIRKNRLEFDFKKLVEKTAKENAWGNEINILCISIMLNRKIFVTNGFNVPNITNRIVYFINDNNREPLEIGFYHSHFFPILKKVIFGKETLECKDFFFYKIDVKTNKN